MRIIRGVEEMQREAERLRLAGSRIGLVPTMGYLHEGHLSLIAHASKVSDVVVVSIFVNPTQFGPQDDFERYPRDLDRDLSLAKQSNVDIVFHPEKSDMYASDFGTYVDEQKVSHILEGNIRPTHFRGVTSVVAKLFNICKPHVALFGQKDAQQVFIVKKMVRDLNFDVDLIVVPIIRESDGLAMSSRNKYLSSDERARASVLHESLVFAEQQIKHGERNANHHLRAEMEKMILGKGPPSIDYIAFVKPDEFLEVESVVKPSVLIAIAVRFGGTRLIDNALIEVG